MRKRMTVSEARAKLFDLVEYVTETPDAAVVIEHRDRRERAVLIDESHYQYLEALASRVRKEAESQPFRLAGSIESDFTAEEIEEWIDQNRREQAELFRKKLDEMFADD
jgi:PHD/YefM family antitoxin component YafN of YafNO toxin-antitoxin module